MRVAPALALAAALSLATAPAVARPCDAAGSLVANCGFDAGPENWLLNGEPATWVTDDCATAPGCVRLDRPTVSTSVEAISDCVAVQPSTEYAFGGSFRLESGAVSQGCLVDFWLHSDANCDTFLDFEFAPFSVSSEWRDQIAGVSTTAATQSMRLRLACFSEGSDFVVRVDDGLVLPAVFVDGFRSGDLSRWSSTAP